MSNRWREYAKSYWIAVQRSGKDRRARQLIFGPFGKLGFGSLYFLWNIYYWYQTDIFAPGQVADNGTRGAMLGMVAVSCVGLLLYLYYSRRNRPIVLNLNAAMAQPIGAAPLVRDYLLERALISASLAARNIGEILMQRHEATPEQIGSSREALNTEIRQAGLWEKLDPLERELCAVPAGSWPTEQLQFVFTRIEQLRLLRWVFRMDDVIVPLAHGPKPDGALTQGVVHDTTKPLLNPWDVRDERDLSNLYAMRLLAEQRQRGLLTPEGAEATKGWAEQLRGQSLGASRDCVVGTKSVEELDNETLSTMTAVAIARCQYAAYLVEVLAAPQPFPFAIGQPAAAVNTSRSEPENN